MIATLICTSVCSARRRWCRGVWVQAAGWHLPGSSSPSSLSTLSVKVSLSFVAQAFFFISMQSDCNIRGKDLLHYRMDFSCGANSKCSALWACIFKEATDQKRKLSSPSKHSKFHHQTFNKCLKKKIRFFDWKCANTFIYIFGMTLNQMLEHLLPLSSPPTVWRDCLSRNFCTHCIFSPLPLSACLA